MTAEHYIQEKERLFHALNGQDRLMETVKDSAEALEKHNLRLMPGTAFNVMVATLETIHLGKFDLSDRNPFQYQSNRSAMERVMALIFGTPYPAAFFKTSVLQSRSHT